MSRSFCYQCRRAKVACLCGRVEAQPNKVNVIVLQHPDEAANPKGSAIIAELGLQQYQAWVGEDFTAHEGLNQLLANDSQGIVVLYPAEDAELLDGAWCKRWLGEIQHIIVIDGTWRKARKIWQLNPQLHSLPAIKFDEQKISEYRIRKVPQQGYLSTVECIVEALRLIEQRPEAYQPLLELFGEMVDFQIKSMGESTYRKNYEKK